MAWQGSLFAVLALQTMHKSGMLYSLPTIPGSGEEDSMSDFCPVWDLSQL